MKNYIEQLEQDLILATSRPEKEEIRNTLQTEKDSCKRILDEYSQREERIGIECKAICEHEKEIIEQINLILNNY